ncbi:uncharacterized protein RHO25_002778 [Cercospora beticola]|uniref:F-box domain-containing protein n=1 Tax=Cercospora beticola TaxID=122368 RepID=A0ABZ0NF78_CERBT|nr:hypothetical protein RHO25_002778 [Cercospora beticola]CAK1359386.1 unnamed protein product [Cercospora beticola]
MNNITQQASLRQSVRNFVRSRIARSKIEKSPDVDNVELSSNTKASTTSANLFSLPVELWSMVITGLSFTDLSNLRSTCCHARELFLKGDLLHDWMMAQTLGQYEVVLGHHIKLYIELYPPPDPMTFDYLLDQRRRLLSTIRLTDALADLVAECNLRSPDRGHRGNTSPISSLVFNSCPETAQVQGNQVPSLLVVQHYFENIRKKMVEFCASKFSDTSDIWDRLHAVTIHMYEKDVFLSAHRMFEVLCWFMVRLLDASGTHIAAFSRRTVSDQDARHFVVMGNLRGIVRLAGLKSSKERQTLVKGLVRSHDPVRNRHWRQAWQLCSLEYRSSMEPARAVNVTNLQFGFQDIWMREAMDHLQRHRIRPARIPLMPLSMPIRRTVDAYTDIAGYHCVQGPGAW